MKIVVLGADGVVGRGVCTRLQDLGHRVIGAARQRPQNWPTAVEFGEVDAGDPAAVGSVVRGADAVVHCGWTGGVDARGGQAVLRATASLVEAVRTHAVGRLVFTSSAQVYAATAQPATESDALVAPTARTVGARLAAAEALIRSSGAEWVICRSGIVIGRDIDDAMLRFLARPTLPRATGWPLAVIHSDDAVRFIVEMTLKRGITDQIVNLAAPGSVALADIAAAVGRPMRRQVRPDALAEWFLGCPSLDTSTTTNTHGLEAVWTARECVTDTALAVRGRITLGNRLWNKPWRLPRVRTIDIPAVDCPASDGVVPSLAGPEFGNGEFDTPIDPRFPTFVATNLSEALPGPFTPSSASVTVLGARAGGVTIARQLRPGGVVEREIAARTVGVFGHRLYAAVTSAHFMAQTVPFTDPMLVLGQFFGRTVTEMPIFGTDLPPAGHTGVFSQLRNIGVFAGNLVGLSAGSVRDTREYLDDVEAFEQAMACGVGTIDDDSLLSMIRAGRDHVVYGWILASASIMLCSAYSVLLRLLSGRDVTPPAGHDVASARSVDAIRRLVALARRDPDALALLRSPSVDLSELASRTPQFHDAVVAALQLIGHRGPAEVEMSSPTYADDPGLLLRMVAKSLDSEPDSPPRAPKAALHVRPVAALAARQLRDREDRRDKMVRAIWLLRLLLREKGRRMASAGVLCAADDVFYLLIDELDPPPSDAVTRVAGRRAERCALTAIVPPPAFSGHWAAERVLPTVLAAGEQLSGLGVCGGRVRGRVRVVGPATIDDLQPGEVLVAQVTDVGYTPAFGYAAAVVTELGGPMSHAAVVAREFGFPCVVDARGATTRLPVGALIEVDGATGAIRVLDADS